MLSSTTTTISTSFPFNRDFINDAKALGGRWNPEDKTWDFQRANLDVDALHAALREHYGYDPEDEATVTVTATAREFISHDDRSLIFGTRKIAYCYGNRDDVKFAPGVKLVAGCIRNSCSRKRACLSIDEGKTLRITGFRKSALDKIDSSDWDVSVA